MDTFFPRDCVNCGELLTTNTVLCTTCYRLIAFLHGRLCVHCGIKLPTQTDHCLNCATKSSYLTALESVFEYNQASKNLIRRLKTLGEMAHVETYASWMFERGRNIIAGADLLVPVPLHRFRLLQRKFNQAAMLAKALNALCGVPLGLLVLKKTQHTKQQSNLSSKMRCQNVLNSFSVTHPELVEEKSVVLVDDVVTTGATLQSCAQTLLNAGARSVKALTLARTMHNAGAGSCK